MAKIPSNRRRSKRVSKPTIKILEMTEKRAKVELIKEVPAGLLKISFECEICEKIFKKYGNLKNHFRNVHKIAELQVDKSSKRVSKQTLKRLEKTEDNEVEIIEEVPKVDKSCLFKKDVFQCEICDKNFTRKDGLKKHLSTNVHKIAELQVDKSKRVSNPTLKRLEKAEKSRVEIVYKVDKSKRVSNPTLKRLEKAEKSKVEIVYKADKSKRVSNPTLKRLEKAEKSKVEIVYKADKSKRVSNQTKRLEKAEKSKVEIVYKADKSKRVSNQTLKRLEKAEKSKVEIVYKADKSKRVSNQTLKRLEKAEKSKVEIVYKVDQSKRVSNQTLKRLEKAEKSKVEIVYKVDQSKRVSNPTLKRLEKTEESKVEIIEEVPPTVDESCLLKVICQCEICEKFFKENRNLKKHLKNVHKIAELVGKQLDFLIRQRPYAMLKAPIPSITEVKQH
jgi:hypothetical protein